MAEDELTPPPDPGRLTPAELLEVRDRLVVAGLHEEGMGQGMALASGQVNAARLPLILAALRDRGDTKALLTRVFAYGDTATPVELESAVGATTLDRLAACNLLGRNEAGDFGCPMLLRPLAGLLLASDRQAATGIAVMTPGPTTANLARALPPPPLGRVLDLGTGSGVLALLAADRGATVTATDITERACAFTRFNAAFNGLAVDVRQGDLFTPVAGDEFDLVVSQPPFVVQPPDVEATTYVHGGPRGEELALRILAGLDAVLAPGGTAILRFDAPGSLEDVVERVRAVVPDPLDLAVFAFATAGSDLIALSYAVMADPALGPRYRSEVVKYQRHMVDLGLDQFTGTMTVVQRRAAGAPPVTLTAAGSVVPVWPYMSARLAAERLASAADTALLSTRLSALPRAILAAELALDQAGQPPRYVVRHPGDAASPDMELNESGAAMLQQFAGGRNLAAVVGAYAEATAKTPEEASPDVLTFARDALRRGLLVPWVG